MKTGSASSFWLLCVISLLAFISYDLIRSPLVPLFAKQLGARPEAVGLIVGLSTITGILFKLPAGTISDRLGRRGLLLAGLFVFAAAPYFYFAVGEVWQLMALRSVHGLATAVFAPVALAVVVDLARDRRAEALSWYGSFSQTGRLSGRMIGGYFIVWWGFGAAFGIAAAAGMIAAALALRLRLPEAPISRAGIRLPAVPPASLWEGLRATAGDRGILATSGMEAVQMTASGALMAFLPLYGLEAGLHAGQIGILFGIMGAASIVVKPLMGRLSDRAGRPPLIIGGQLICAAVMILLPWTGRFDLLLALSFLFGFGEAVIGSSTSALVADLSQRKSLGSAMGVFGTIMDLGHACGPILTGLLIGVWGYAGAFTGVGTLLLLMTLLFRMLSLKETGTFGAPKSRG